MPDLNLTSSLYPVFSLTGDDLRFSISADLGFIVQAVSATTQRVHPVIIHSTVLGTLERKLAAEIAVSITYI